MEKDWFKEARTSADTPCFDYFTNLAFAPPGESSTTSKLPNNADENNEAGEGDDAVEEEVGESNRAVWFECDKAAFVEALKSPHRYCQDTMKRKQECARLEDRLNKMRGAGETGGDVGEEETSDRLAGFTGDHRIGLDTTIPGKKGIWQLIHDEDLLAYREEDHASETVEEETTDSIKCSVCCGPCHGYGINENTLRGWRELRQKWREAAASPLIS